MKNMNRFTLTQLALSVLLFAGIAVAQYMPRVVRVSVPFEFTAAGKTFPAGDYAVVRTAPWQIEVRDLEGHVLTSIVTHSVKSLQDVTATKLEFLTVDGVHQLRQVWIKGNSIGYELPAVRNTNLLAKRTQHQADEGSSGGNK